MISFLINGVHISLIYIIILRWLIDSFGTKNFDWKKVNKNFYDLIHTPSKKIWSKLYPDSKKIYIFNPKKIFTQIFEKLHSIYDSNTFFRIFSLRSTFFELSNPTKGIFDFEICNKIWKKYIFFCWKISRSG